MLHDSKLITMQAKELLLTYGDNAEQIALTHMYHNMEEDDVLQAAFWMAVIHEIRRHANSSSQLN